MNINELLDKIQEIVPLNNAFEDDNVGLIIGSGAVSYTHLTLPTKA